MRRARGWLGPGALVIGAVVVGVLLAEAGLRLFYPQNLGVWHQDREGLGMHWPGLATHLRQYGVDVSYNSVGMRDREHPRTKPPGVLRVLVLGDSFMEAHQVAFEASFPSLVERELNRKAGRRIEVVNASVSGWGTDDELKYLIRYGMQWKPDLVLVVMTLHNDISENLRERFHTIRDGALVEQARPPDGLLRYEILQLKAYLNTRSHAYVLVRRAWRTPEVRMEARALRSHVVELFRPTPDAQMSRGLELTASLLERMRALASAEGSRLAVVLLPLAVQLSDERFAELVRAVPGSPAALQMDQPQRMVKRITDRLGIPVIDLLPGFRDWAARGGDSLFLEPDGHWNERGHRLATELVARELITTDLVTGQHAGSTPATRSVRR